MNSKEKQKFLFSDTPIAANFSSKNPVIVVGLPRSGSSFLSDVISQINDCYVFDDLYLHRKACSIGVRGRLTRDQLEKLIYFLGWQIRARLKFGTFSVPNLSMEDVDKMDESLFKSFERNPPTWDELQEEWLVRLSLLNNGTTWGYKAPGDFLNIDLLKKVYPNARFIFLVRNPINVMRSYKYLHKDSKDGNSQQYHPIAYSLYWKMLVESYNKYAKLFPDSILLVKFETLISSPSTVAASVADFLGCEFDGNLTVRKPNTSFPGRQKKEITLLEKWLCERVARQQMQQMGYPTNEGKLKISDFVDFFKTSYVFAFYQTKRIFKNEYGGLFPIKNFFKKLLRR